MKIDKRIKFEEEYVSMEDNITTYYYTADKSLLNELFPGKYPEADSMTISIEFPTDYPEANMADVMVSPTEDGSDYDWSDINIPYEEIEKLLQIAHEHLKKTFKMKLNTLIANAEKEAAIQSNFEPKKNNLKKSYSYSQEK